MRRKAGQIRKAGLADDVSVVCMGASTDLLMVALVDGTGPTESSMAVRARYRMPWHMYIVAFLDMCGKHFRVVSNQIGTHS